MSISLWFGIDKTLNSILSILKDHLDNLQSNMGNTGIGFTDIAGVVGGAIGAKTLKDKIFGPKGGPKPPGGATPPGTTAPKKAGFFEKVFGKSGSSIADAAHGRPPISTAAGAAGEVGAAEAGAAGKAGGWFGKLGKFMKLGSKVAAPLTVAMTMAENMDELSKTGAVNPLAQAGKAAGGLGKVFDTDKPFFSMSRLEGAGEAIGGATGAVYGVGTQIGKAINDIIPDDVSDQIVDGIVSLFGGETNADRAKKQKELEEKQAKDWEERKKIREAEKKRLEDEQKKVDEDKKAAEEKRIAEERAILKEGQMTASAGNTAGAVSDTPGVNVANTADVGGLKPSSSSVSGTLKGFDTSKLPKQFKDFVAEVDKEGTYKGDPNWAREEAKDRWDEYVMEEKKKAVQVPTPTPTSPTPVTSVTTPNIVEATQKAAMAVQINQPKDQPIPVAMTDEKGTPLVSSVDRKEQANLLGGSTPAPAPAPPAPPPAGAPAAPPATTGAGAPAAVPAPAAGAPTAPGAPAAAPVALGKIDHTPSTSTRSVSQTLEELGLTPERISTIAKAAGFDISVEEAKNSPDKALAKIGVNVASLLHQSEAETHIPTEKTPWRAFSTEQRGSGSRAGTETKRTNSKFGGQPTVIEQAKVHAAVQDVVAQAQTPTTPSTPVTTQPIPAPGMGTGAPTAPVAPAGAPAPTAPGQRTVAGSYTPTPEDSKYFKGDLSKLKGMDPVFVDKLKAASAEAGVALPLTSGFRTQEKQDQLRAEAVKKYGSEEAASKWVAKTSIHTTGNAADFSMGGDAEKFWNSNPALVKAMEKQGLHRPLSNEAWHWESDLTKGQNRKGLAAKLIEQRNASLAAGTQPQTGQASLAQTAQGVATGVPAMLAAQGVPGAAAVSGAVAKAPKISADVMGRFNQVKGNLQQAAQATGVNAGTLAKITNIESRFKTDAKAGISSAQGLGQFINSTWTEQMAAHGAKYGVKGSGPKGQITKEDAEKYRNDPQMQANMLAEYSKQGIKLGEKYNLGDQDAMVYAHHNLGPGGAKRLFEAAGKNPNAPITSVLTAKEIKNNPSLYKSGMTAKEAFDNLGKKMREGEKFAQEMGAPSQQISASPTTPTAPQVTPAPTTTTAPQVETGTAMAPPPPATAAAPATQPAPTTTTATQPAPTRVPVAAGKIDHKQSTSTRSVDSSLAEMGLTPDMVKAGASALGMGEKSADELLTMGGKEIASLLHQGEAYTHTPTAETPWRAFSSAQRGNGSRAGKETIRTNSKFGGQATVEEKARLSPNPIAQNTVSGMTPPAADISTQAPSDVAALGPRAAQNYNLLGMPQVQASLDALQAGGAKIGSGLSAVDAIRQSGGLGPMVGGDLSGLVGRVAPELSSAVNGIQGVFNQSLSGGGGFARNFNQATGNALKGTGIPKAIGSALGTSGIQGPISVGNAAGGVLSSLMGGGAAPLQATPNQGLGNALENAGWNDKMGEMQASASTQSAMSAQNSAMRPSETRGPSERGSSVMDGQNTPIEVRNPESSIRRLTDMLIAYTFG